MVDQVYEETNQSQDRIHRLRRTLESVMGIPATEGNQVIILHNCDKISPTMLEAIGSARDTIDFLTFVYWKGEFGRQFAERLAETARAGVRVRVLLDASGSRPIERSKKIDLQQWRHRSLFQRAFEVATKALKKIS